MKKVLLGVVVMAGFISLLTSTIGMADTSGQPYVSVKASGCLTDVKVDARLPFAYAFEDAHAYIKGVTKSTQPDGREIVEKEVGVYKTGIRIEIKPTEKAGEFDVYATETKREGERKFGEFDPITLPQLASRVQQSRVTLVNDTWKTVRLDVINEGCTLDVKTFEVEAR